MGKTSEALKRILLKVLKPGWKSVITYKKKLSCQQRIALLSNKAIPGKQLKETEITPRTEETDKST